MAGGTLKLDLRELLYKKKMSQAELGRQLGLSRSMISQIARGIINFPYDYRMKFCNLMDIDFESFSMGRIRKKRK